jgi:hypothetical protein
VRRSAWNLPDSLALFGHICDWLAELLSRVSWWLQGSRIVYAKYRVLWKWPNIPDMMLNNFSDLHRDYLILSLQNCVTKRLITILPKHLITSFALRGRILIITFPFYCRCCCLIRNLRLFVLTHLCLCLRIHVLLHILFGWRLRQVPCSLL